MYDLSLGETKLSVQTLPRFFQLLTWTSQGKTVGTTGKSALKLLNLLSLKVIHPKRAKIQLCKDAKTYRRLYSGEGWRAGGGGENWRPPTIQTIVKFRAFEGQYIRYISTNYFLTWQVYLFKRFLCCGVDGFFLTRLCQKLKKTKKKTTTTTTTKKKRGKVC